jgi:hypothetical protein
MDFSNFVFRLNKKIEVLERNLKKDEYFTITKVYPLNHYCINTR